MAEVTKKEILKLLDRVQNAMITDIGIKEEAELQKEIEKFLKKHFPEEYTAAKQDLQSNPDYMAELEKLKSYEEKPEKILSVMCKNLGLPVSKVAKNAPALINGEALGVNVKNSKDKKAKDIYVNVVALNEIQLPERITRRDCYICTVCASLYEAGNEIITPELVYRTLNGLDNEAGIKPQAIAAITRSMNKQRLVDIEIDFTEQARQYPDVKRAKFRNYMLPTSVVEVELQNGRKSTGYKCTGMPPIYEYSKAIKHIRTIPAELLSIKGLRGSDEITTVKFYLLEQIESIKSGGRNAAILYETLLNACEIDTKGNREIARRYRNYIEIMLQQWTEQGYIKGYEQRKKGRSIDAVIIKL